jgi:lysyl-tRNA synthetase class 1
MIRQHLGKPLCTIPDPFGTAKSFSDHMNEKLIEFLNKYQLEHEYRSSHVQYESGVFNEVLQRVLENVERIKGVILPTLQPENRKEWSPFMPLCESCGRNLTTVVTGYHPASSEVEYKCVGELHNTEAPGCGHKGKRSVLNGGAKVGWKVDWALRWTAFDVDFEMYGKDLIESYALSKKICNILGGIPPQDYFYEMFLDDEGKKISKSVGKGLTIDEWIKYAPLESLTYYLFINPRRAKKLYFDVIPKAMDEYLQHLAQYPKLASEAEKLESPIWHIHYPDPARIAWDADINFSLINNLVSALGTDDRKVIRDYIRQYDGRAENYPHILDNMIEGSVHYYQDHILPTKKFYAPNPEEKKLISGLVDRLKNNTFRDGDEIQTLIFSVAKDGNVEAKAFFQLLYRSMLGQESGPRLGAFFRLLGKVQTAERLSRLLAA